MPFYFLLLDLMDIFGEVVADLGLSGEKILEVRFHSFD